MLKQTVSFWRRLLQSGSRTHNVSPLTDDRRNSTRIPAHGEVIYYPAGKETSVRLKGQLRNVSVGGLNMAVNQPFQPGTLLNVQLPLHHENVNKTVLACVVHTRAESETQWALGCTFARELNEQDLRSFGFEQDLEIDQRSRPRFPCEIEAKYQSISTGDAPVRLTNVWNISTTGVGLLVNEAIAPGTLLNLELFSPHSRSKTILGCVVHVTCQDSDSWIVGCNFITEMSEDDLQALLS